MRRKNRDKSEINVWHFYQALMSTDMLVFSHFVFHSHIYCLFRLVPFRVSFEPIQCYTLRFSATVVCLSIIIIIITLLYAVSTVPQRFGWIDVTPNRFFSFPWTDIFVSVNSVLSEIWMSTASTSLKIRFWCVSQSLKRQFMEQRSNTPS